MLGCDGSSEKGGLRKLLRCAGAVWPAIWMVGLCHAQTPSAQPWIKLNGGLPLYHEGRVVGATRATSGNLHFVVAHGGRGSIGGRFTHDGQWQLFTPQGFSSDSHLLPASMANALARYDHVKLFPLPGGGEDDLLGVGFFRFGGLLFGGTHPFDIHGNLVGLRFSGGQWTQWHRAGQFRRHFLEALLETAWNGCLEMDAAFDPTSGTVLLVATRQDFGAPPETNVLRYREGEQSWRLWREGGWGADHRWAESARRFVKTNLDPHHEQISSLILLHVGGGNYLLTFQYQKTGQPPIFTAARYRESDGQWQGWNGATWVAAGPWEFGPVVTGYFFPRLPQTAFVSPDGIARLFFTNVAAGWRIEELRYDDRTESFAVVPTDLQVERGTAWQVVGDAQGNAWLVAQTAWSSADGEKIRAAYQPYGGAWSPITTVYSPPATAERGGLAVGALAFHGRAGTHLVGFISERIDGVDRPFAISPAALPAEQPLLLAPPIHRERNPKEVTLVAVVSNQAPDLLYAGGTAGGHLARDHDGYLYAPRPGYCETIVRRAEDTDWTRAHSWGAFWDHLFFPGGAAVDNLGGKVYVTTDLVQGGGGSLPFNHGRIRAFDVSYRDQSLGFNWLGGPLPPRYDDRYAPQTFGWCSYPADVSVDERRRLLYVTAAADGRIDVYSLRDLIDHDGPGHSWWIQWLLHHLPPEDHAAAQGALAALVAQGHMAWSPDRSGVYWVSRRWEESLALLRSLGSYANLSELGRRHLERNLMSFFKEKRQVPGLIGSIGGEGEGNGQFRFPQATDVDPDGNLYVADMLNHRIQKFAPGGEFLASTGGLGSEGNPLLYPVGLAADPRLHLLYVTDPVNRRFLILDREGTHLTSWTADLLAVTADGTGTFYASHRDGTIHTYRIVDAHIDRNGNGIPDSLEGHLTFTLTVQRGAGSGAYPAGAVVPIAADPPAPGQVFAAWRGDIAHVANVYAARTTVTMPPRPVEVTATYRPAPDPSNRLRRHLLRQPPPRSVDSVKRDSGK